MDTTTTRRPCFIEEDDGLASIADIEAGFSGNHHYHHFFSRPLCYTALQRKSSLNSLPISSSSSFSPRSVARFYNGRFEEPQQQTYFLEACFLCKKQLGDNIDIFMYRGDTPFCSEECRQEQIDIDESKEKNKNRSSSMKAMRKDQKKSNSPNKTQDYPFRTGAVAAA